MRLIRCLLAGHTDRADEDQILAILVSASGGQLDEVVRRLSCLGCLRQLFADVDGHNHRCLIRMLAYYLTDELAVVEALDALSSGRVDDDERVAITDTLAYANLRSDLERVVLALRQHGIETQVLGSPPPTIEELRASLPNKALPYPFSRGAGGNLTPFVGFEEFLGGGAHLADPTDANIVEKTRTLLLPYFATGQFGELRGAEGVPLRYVVFAPPPGQPVKGVINLMAGWSESTVKYAELIYNMRHLRAQGYVIAMMDHRGQGFSGRELDAHKGHVQTFDHYVADQKAFRAILTRHYGAETPFALFAHSMGAVVATRYMQTYGDDYRTAVLSSPMYDMESGLPNAIEYAIAKAGALVAGTTYSFKSGGPYKPMVFETQKVTNCRERVESTNWLYQHHPEVQLGGPTFGWVNQAAHALSELATDEQVRKLAGKKITLLQPTADRVVVTSAQDDVVRRAGLQKRVYPDIQNGQDRGSQHELLFHGDQVRRRVVADISSLLLDGLRGE